MLDLFKRVNHRITEVQFLHICLGDNHWRVSDVVYVLTGRV